MNTDLCPSVVSFTLLVGAGPLAVTSDKVYEGLMQRAGQLFGI